MDKKLEKDAPEGSSFDAQENGWITSTGFLKWMKEFVNHVHPTEDNPVLLIVDGHSSHKDLEVILFARENHVHMLSLPPHTTHMLQPLDRAVMKPFKDAYNEACGAWMRKYHYLKLSLDCIAGLVDNAFTKICRMEIAKKAFECTGIYPLNRGIFTDLDFVCSEGLHISNSLYEQIHVNSSSTTSVPGETFTATNSSVSATSNSSVPTASTSSFPVASSSVSAETTHSILCKKKKGR
jgi:hypothetical protein